MRIVLVEDLYLLCDGDRKLLAEAGDVLEADEQGIIPVTLDDGFIVHRTLPSYFYRVLDC